MATRLTSVVLLLVVFAGPVKADQESPALRPLDRLGTAQAQDTALTLSLRECVEIALGRNLSLKIDRLNVDIFETFIPEQRSVFDHIWSTGYQHQDLETPNVNPFLGGETSGGISAPVYDPVLIDLLTDQRLTLSEFMDLFDFLGGFQPTGPVTIAEYSDERNRYETGLSKTFSWGTQYDLSLNLERYETSNPYEGLNPGTTSEFRLTITQPLLKNFGRDANTTAIRLAENDLGISESDLRARVILVIYDVEQAYWTLILRQEQLGIQEESLGLAQDLLVNNTARVQAGVLAPIEILSASSGVAARREGVIVAKNALVDAEDNLKRILELRDGNDLWDIHIVPADKPEYSFRSVDLTYSLKLARQWRPEFQRAELSVDNTDLSARMARNQLLPQLDLSVGAWASGLGRNKNKSLDLLNDGEFLSFTAGIQLTYPLGNRAAKARSRRAALRSEQARTTLDDLFRSTEMEVRAAVRQIETNRQRIEATEIAAALAEERLKAEEEALRVGMSTSHDVLDFQEDLTIARGSYTQAVIDHILSCARLEFVQGTLPEALGFRIED